MKKFISVFLSALFICSLLTLVSFAEDKADACNKADLYEGAKIAAVKYDVASGVYVYGEVTVIIRRVNDSNNKLVSYFVLDEKTFTAVEGNISASTKNKISLVEQCVNQVFINRKGEINYTNFGRVDSESAPYSLTIAPYAVPMLEEKGFSATDNIWMAMGNKAGKVEAVYINVAEADIYQEPAGTPVVVSVVTPKKMSIRLEDGTILKTGDTFTVAIGQTVRFQMCSNNWDNDTYDDNGNGIAGTVVYSFRIADNYWERSYDAEAHAFVSPKGDPVLRTDTNKCFMAYRYYFTKGDYNKQTGIKQVVNTPLEALSVNLPLGSTITSDAYKAYKWLDTANVFIETAADKSVSYTDYYWNY